MIRGQKIMVIYCAVLSVLGLILFALALFVYFYDRQFLELMKETTVDYDMFTIIACILGGLILIVGLIFTFCIRQNKCLLLAFQGFLLFVFILALIIAVFACWFAMNNPLSSHYYQDIKKGRVSPFMNFCHKKFECCGWYGPGNFADPKFYNKREVDEDHGKKTTPAVAYYVPPEKERTFPPSCCIQPKCVDDLSGVYEAGCSDAIRETFDVLCITLAVLGIVIALYALVGLILLILIDYY